MKKYNDDEPVTYGMLKKELGTLSTGLRGEIQALDEKLTEQNLQLDKKLSKQNEQLDKKLTEQNLQFDKKLSKQNEQLDKKLTEQNEQLDKKLTERNERLVSGFGIWRTKIEEDIADIKERMYTKEDHARDLVWMDDAMVEILAAREERILFQRQLLRMDDRYYDHEKRIVALEKR